MFNKIMAAFKGVLAKMGLINEINNVTQFAAVQETEWDYERILVWRALYRGWLDKFNGVPFHETSYTTVDGQKRKRMKSSLMMPKVASEKMAALVYNEKCVINISDEQLSKNVMKVLNDNSFNKQFQRFLEYGFALGGFVIKPYVVNGKIKLSFVTAQNFFPLQSTNDDIQAGVFLSETRKGDKFYSLLEWHQWDGTTYVISNQLYQSSEKDSLGVQVSLNLLYPNMEPELRIDNLDKPLFVYIKPNIANNFETTSPLGISIFANSMDTLKALDIAFDSFQREFTLGKRRIMVPASALRTVVDPTTGSLHRYFDTEDEVYQALATDKDAEQIQDLSTPLRVTDHISAINALLNLLAMQMGFSAGTFTFTNGGIKTATEVISENSDTFRTKQSHETLIEQGFKELVDIIIQLAQLYDIFDAPTSEFDITVEFDDSIVEDKMQNANFYITLIAAGVMPKVEAIKRIFDMTDEQAQKWVDKINTESAQAAPVDPNGETEGDAQVTSQKPESMLTSFMNTAELNIKNADR